MIKLFLILNVICVISNKVTAGKSKKQKLLQHSKISIKTPFVKKVFKLTFFGNEDNEKLIKYHLITNTICYIGEKDKKNIYKDCNKSFDVSGNQFPILLVNNKQILIDELYLHSVNYDNADENTNPTNYLAILTNEILLSRNEIFPSINQPIFSMENSSFSFLQEIAENKSKFIYSRENSEVENTFTITIDYDNTEILLPLYFMNLTKITPILSGIIISGIAIRYRNKKDFFCIISTLGGLKLFYSVMNFLLISASISYNKIIYDTYSEFYNIFSYVINSIFISLFYSTIAMLCNGWSIFYSSIRGAQTKKFFIIFVSIYIAFSIDYLFLGFELECEFETKIFVIKVKYILINFFTCSTCIVVLKNNSDKIKVKMIYALYFARNLFEKLQKKVYYITFLKICVFSFSVAVIGSSFAFEKYKKSIFYETIQREVKETVESLFCLFFLWGLFYYEEDYEMIEFQQVPLVKKVAVFKYNGNKVEDMKEFSFEKSIPYVVLDPFDKEIKTIGYIKEEEDEEEDPEMNNVIPL